MVFLSKASHSNNTPRGNMKLPSATSKLALLLLATLLLSSGMAQSNFGSANSKISSTNTVNKKKGAATVVDQVNHVFESIQNIINLGKEQ